MKLKCHGIILSRNWGRNTNGEVWWPGPANNDTRCTLPQAIEILFLFLNNLKVELLENTDIDQDAVTPNFLPILWAMCKFGQCTFECYDTSRL
jgi:hypothetical protein